LLSLIAAALETLRHILTIPPYELLSVSSSRRPR